MAKEWYLIGNPQIYNGGCEGEADEAVNALLEGRLSYVENPVCTHHEEHHPEECH